MTEPALPLIVCDVRMANGPKWVVALMPPGLTLESGLAPEQVVGELLSAPPAEATITPDNFARNPTFVAFLHRVIATHGPTLPGLADGARAQGKGWLYVIDGRTTAPDDAVPPEDIFGAFEVANGRIVEGSYQASERHQILSPRGFFQLHAALREYLIAELVRVAGADAG